MKKKIMTYCMILSILFVAGCQKEASNLPSDSAPFENAEWIFYNEVTGENDVIRFGEDNSFSYHCECGEPVGDSDCYDRYRYEEEELRITLYNDYDDNEKEIKVLSYNVSHLLLEIDGVIRDFTTESMDHSSSFWREQGESYLCGYEMNRMLTEFTDSGLMTAAVNYDTETKAPKGTLEEYGLAEEAVFFELNLFSQWAVIDGVEEEQSYDAAYTELTKEDMEYIFENGGAPAYLWLNENMEIEKAVLWGMDTVIE